MNIVSQSQFSSRGSGKKRVVSKKSGNDSVKKSAFRELKIMKKSERLSGKSFILLFEFCYFSDIKFLHNIYHHCLVFCLVAFYLLVSFKFKFMLILMFAVCNTMSFFLNFPCCLFNCELYLPNVIFLAIENIIGHVRS